MDVPRMHLSASPRLQWLGLTSLLFLACGGPEIDLPHFNDMESAPVPIQNAAKAVVRIRTAFASGTGAFISANGLLLTNNHVLGVPVCPVEGCYLQIARDYQKGIDYRSPITVFARPVAVDVGLDMAIVQLYTSAPLFAGGETVSSPDFLLFHPQDAASLIGTHVTIVGHPKGHLKKWTDGVVVGADGSWFTSTVFILPGDSGSPVLDDGGQIVGLIHRSPEGQDLITSRDVNVSSIGTASAPIVDKMQAPLPASMISLTAPTTPERVVENNAVYLNAHARTVNVGMSSDPLAPTVAILTLLEQACDVGLTRMDFASPGDLSLALSPCYSAMTWIDCRPSQSAAPSYFPVCPDQNAAAAWSTRFREINQRWLAMNGTLDLTAISFAQAQLQLTQIDGVAVGASVLTQELASTHALLDFRLANYLVAFNVLTYANADVASYVQSYRSALHYELQAQYIANAVAWMFSNQALSKDKALAIWAQLHADPNVDIGAKLQIEEYEYWRGAY